MHVMSMHMALNFGDACFSLLARQKSYMTTLDNIPSFKMAIVRYFLPYIIFFFFFFYKEVLITFLHYFYTVKKDIS